VDHVVDPSSGRIIASTVSSRDVTERILENSYHVATLDNDAPTIFEESARFVRRVTGT
jgi:carboxylesterase